MNSYSNATLLFTGPNQVELFHAALSIAQDLLEDREKVAKQNHPDLHILKVAPDAATHSMSSIRALIDEMHLPPYQAKRKIFIIERAEAMLPTSAHALLKTLEEPSQEALIILLCREKKELLPTIRSRCHVIDFHTPQPVQHNQKLLEILSEPKEHLDLLKALDELEASLPADQQSEAITQIFEAILFWYRDRHLLALSGPQEQLFHKEHLALLKRAESLPLPPLSELFTRINRYHLGAQRHIRLRTLLESLFLSLSSSEK